jgi:predicted DNA-binding transcriptional regulator AlpA
MLQTDSNTTKLGARPEPLLVPDRVACVLAGVSRASWWRLHSAARTPAAIKLGRAARWDRSELAAWIEARCPNRQTWEAMRAQRQRLRRVGS